MPKSENAECYFLDTNLDNPVTSEMIQQKTRVDPVTSRVHSYILHGWPSHSQDPPFAPYNTRKTELSGRPSMCSLGCTSDCSTIITGTNIKTNFMILTLE